MVNRIFLIIIADNVIIIVPIFVKIMHTQASERAHAHTHTHTHARAHNRNWTVKKTRGKTPLDIKLPFLVLKRSVL